MATTVPEPEDAREIVLDNIGPHEKLRLKAPPGKITVLVGPNGAGKTQVLDAVDAVQRGAKRLTSRDGTMGGTARFGGATIRVTRAGVNRRSGELEVESLEDRLSIATFVDPGLQDRAAADERRIRALLLLAGAEPDIDRFQEIADAETLEEIAPEAVKADDIIKQAAKIKAAFEAEARRVEKQAANLERERDGIAAANEGIDLTAPHDEAELNGDMLAARDQWAELRERRRAGLAAQEAAEEAKRRLSEAKSSYSGDSVKEAEAGLESSKEAVQQAIERVERAERLLAEAKKEKQWLEQRVEEWEKSLAAARAHEATIAGWRETVESAIDDIPSQEEVDAAEREFIAAKEAAENGVRIRDAMQRREQVERLSQEIREMSERAESLRNTARNTQVVLSRMVAELGVPLRVDEEFRLIARHPQRGECYFDELSMGEKWKLGIDIVLSRAGDEPALLSIPQEAWESLDGRNRRLIAEAIAGTDLSIITAEAQQYRECPDCGARNTLTAEVCSECAAQLGEPALTAAEFGG